MFERLRLKKDLVAEIAVGDPKVSRKLMKVANGASWQSRAELREYLLGYIAQETGREVVMADIRANGKDYWKKFTRK